MERRENYLVFWVLILPSALVLLMYVTVTTYRHLLLMTKDDQQKHPVLIGPLLFMLKKISRHIIFASSLVSKKPELAELQCFGTDGESDSGQESLQLFVTA